MASTSALCRSWASHARSLLKSRASCSSKVTGVTMAVAQPTGACSFSTSKALANSAPRQQRILARPLAPGADRLAQANSFLCSDRHSLLATKSAAQTTRLRVAVDVDEVLGRFVYALNRFCEEKYSMRHSVSDYWIYEFAKIWGCSQDRSNQIVHEFFKSQHFNDGIPVIPGAYDVLGRLGEECDLVVVTSRQHVIQDQTLDWIDRHYPGIFQEVYFGNHWSLEGVSRKKSDICKAIGATVLIDDNPTYALECASAGIHVLLYDWDHAYPWSKLQPGQQHPLITVVGSWEEAERQLAQMAPELRAKMVSAAGKH